MSLHLIFGIIALACFVAQFIRADFKDLIALGLAFLSLCLVFT